MHPTTVHSCVPHILVGTCHQDQSGPEDCVRDPLHWTVPVGTGVEEVVNGTLQSDELEERDLQKVHGNVELQHERCKNCIAVVQDCYDEYPVRGRGRMQGLI